GVPLGRPAASRLGAVAMVSIGRLPLAEAYAAIDMDVIVFLLGLMLVVGYLEEARFFEWVAQRVVERATTPRLLLAAVVLTSGVLSALFVNDTICLVLTPLPLVAISAGALMVAAARRDPTPALARVEWPLLLFFAALFVLMRGFETTGAVDAMTAAAAPRVEGNGLERAAAVSGIMLVLSNLVSNVPAVLLWAPVVPSLPAARELWLLLAMSATFAGNLILIGSMANLIVAERAAARGVRLGFIEYARVGVPLALLTTLWG